MDFELGGDVWLWLDPSQACNISCALCYTRPSQAKNFLSVDDARLFSRKLCDAGINVREITLNWRGEPLMNKRFPEILDIVTASFPRTRVQFHSNAMLLGERVCDQLCRIERPFFIYLSVDGGTAQSHEKNRGPDTFRRAVRGGHNLLRRRGDRAWPHISLYQLDLGVDERAYDPEFLQLARRCDIWQRVNPIVANGSDPAHSEQDRDVAGIAPEIFWDADATGPQPAGACFWAGFSLSISPDGTVSPCILTQLSNDDAVFGNLRVDSVATILQRATAFRWRLEAEGRGAIPLCASCYKVEGRPRPPREPRNLQLSHGELAAN